MRAFVLLLVLIVSIVVVEGRTGDLAAAFLSAPPAKRIALTFDDAPRSRGAFFSEDERAAKLIAALKAANVEQVAFFINPGRISRGDGDEARIMRYVEAGHVIGNHTFDHRLLSHESTDSFFADVDQASAWLSNRAGYRPWFRFPGLDEGGVDTAKRDAVRAGLAARGLRNAYVTVDGLDWNIEARTIAAARMGRAMDMDALRTLYVETMVQAADFSDGLAIRAIGRSPIHVLLLHETDVAALYIGDLVDALRKDGWEVVTTDAAYADPVYAQAPDVRNANGTLIEQLAWTNHVTGPRWYERDNIRVGDALFDSRVLHPPARGAVRSAR